jgi:hypothetical protein
MLFSFIEFLPEFSLILLLLSCTRVELTRDLITDLTELADFIVALDLTSDVCIISGYNSGNLRNYSYFLMTYSGFWQ